MMIVPYNVIDLTGQVFGRLTVVGFVGITNRRTLWACACSCDGKEVEVSSHCLRAKSRGTKSCGCLQIEATSKHGKTDTPEFIAWSSMLCRCKSQANYISRNIKVCDRWLESFENFYEDMGDRPSDKSSIDRIDNNGNYCKENCRWADDYQQNNNRRTCRFLTANGKTMTIAQWSRELNIPHATLTSRANKGWSDDMILNVPVDATANRQDIHYLTYQGVTLNVTEWAKLTGIVRRAIYMRINNSGWSIEDALTTPVGGARGSKPITELLSAHQLTSSKS